MAAFSIALCTGPENILQVGSHERRSLPAQADWPSGVDWDQKTKTKGVYRIVEPGHRGWSRNVDTELGNYDFLLGVDVKCLVIFVSRAHHN